MNDDDVITAVREQRDKVHSHTSVDQILSRGRTIRARRRIPGAATGLAVAAASGTALALGLTGVIGAAPARSTDMIRTAAFTLTRNANGTDTLTINLNVLFDPRTLQKDLARYGIPAKVTVGRFCSSDPAPAGFFKVVGEVQGRHLSKVTINPATMPAGAELSVGAFHVAGGQRTALALIDTKSYTCASTMPATLPAGGMAAGTGSVTGP